MNISQSGKGILFMLTGYAVYSLHDLLVRSMSEYSVFQTMFFAMLFSYLPFSVAGVIEGSAISLRPNNPAIVLLRTFLMMGSLTCTMLAFSSLPMVHVYVLLFTTPMFISILAIPILKERVGMYRTSMIALGLIGVIVVLRPSIDSLQLGHLFGLTAAFCSAFAAILARKIGHSESAATLIMLPLMLNIIVSGSTLYFVYQPMQLTALASTFLIGTLALLGQVLILNGFRRAPSTLTAPMQYSQLLWALLYSYVLFNDPVDVNTIIGASITISSGVLILWRESRVSKQKPVLSTRNMRSVNTTPVPSSQYDEKEQ